MNNNIKNEIEIKQINPKLRLFLLVFCNWLWIPLTIIFVGQWASLAATLPFFQEHRYLTWILLGCWTILTFFNLFVSLRVGIKYLPKDLYEHYLQKNSYQLKKINNLEVTNVTQLFNVTPICQEIYLKKSKSNKKCIQLSWIEENKNRLVVNGKINHLDFSWGIITKMKKNNFKGFLLAILYFGPIFGIIYGLLLLFLFNSVDFSERSQKNNYTKYTKLGSFDLVTKNIGDKNSKNYLIFAAKLKKQVERITLIPNNNKYEWPTNLSETQKQELQNLIKEMPYLPSIYISQDNISIIMKKYHYNAKDNNELQTWELLKQENSNNEIQFNYLNNAIKIYHIFNKNSFDL
ncbi:hypothetical protein LT336_00739 [Spiroplasma sp. JKS002671]|uniref:hypothetical protein n=1 Tax=Spiroplasma attinicola TaxID=2904537 RepID=UPI002022A452|nr:hypothetical protein [Spiroplasma sp. JKS002671]MCL8210987.1 hypothetical protein [Spiroplasma sp. JKS002671]